MNSMDSYQVPKSYRLSLVHFGFIICIHHAESILARTTTLAGIHEYDLIQ